MKIKRYFYNSSINFRSISHKRLVFSIAIGLASAFTIYCFFYVLRESFRVMSYQFEQIPNILSDSDRNFYNIFFAGLSLVLGNSITILLVFSKPNKSINRFNPKRKRLLNDQIFLSLNFMYVFAKIGLVFGIFSMCCMDFNFLSDYKPLCFLLLFVLFLESWKNLSTVIRKDRFKFQFINFLCLIVFTFGLSRFNIINYHAIDKLILKNNPLIDLPYSNFYNDNNYRYNPEIKLKLKLNENDSLEIFTDEKKKINLSDVRYIIAIERASIREGLIPSLSVRISANKDIELKYIKMLEAELYVVNQSRVIYDVYNDDILSSRFGKRELRKEIPESVLDYRLISEFIVAPYPPIFENEYNFNDTLKIKINEKVSFDGIVIPHNMLVEEFKSHINKTTLFEYNFNLKTKYQEYITVLSAHHEAIEIVRQSHATIGFDISKERYYLNKNERIELNKLKERFPVYISEKLN